MFWTRRVFLDIAAGMEGNPSSAHAEGRAAKAALEHARKVIAEELQMKADDLIFTSGATEANNIAIQGVSIAAHGRGIAEPHVLYLPSAHASTVKTLQTLTQWGIKIEPLVVKGGEIDISTLAGQVRADTVLVCVDAMCGETGTIWNTRDVKRAIGNVPLLVDASQAPLEEGLDRSRWGADLLTLDASKVGTMRGAGVLAAPRSVPLLPLMRGGGQERGVRPGTENVAAIAAFAESLVRARKERESFARRARSMRENFLRAIESIPNHEVNQGKKGIAHIVNLSLRGRDTDYLQALLDEAGFAVSTKSACESDSEEGSRAVLALTGDTERAGATLRISWGPTTGESDLSRFAHALIKAVDFLDAHAA